jgi:hypothetical protein
MNHLTTLRELPATDTCAVIINCGTKWFTTLALASTIANTRYPVVIIDCESGDGSEEHFLELSRRYRWDVSWLRWPLRPHWQALDQVFLEIAAARVLLVDSDVELRTSSMPVEMQAALDQDPSAYGSGLLHGARWMGRESGLLDNVGFYAPRMWIPLVLLRTSHIRAALHEGGSFEPGRIYQECGVATRWARLVAARHRIIGLRRLELPRRPSATLTGAPRSGEAIAAFVEYDTGARLHDRLTRRGLTFKELPGTYWQAVHHYHGVTRATIASWPRRISRRLGIISRHTETPQQDAVEHAKSRLAAHYAIDTAA